MIDFAESLKSGLSKPHQKLKRTKLVPVRASDGGKILKWFKNSGLDVTEDEPLCEINSDILDPDSWNVYTVFSPATGTLFIFEDAKVGRIVTAGQKIANIAVEIESFPI